MKTALIDGDIVVYSCGLASDNIYYEVEGQKFENKGGAKLFCAKEGIHETDIQQKVDPEPLNYCLHSVKKMIENVVYQSGCDSNIILLSHKKQFRKVAFPTYKANRKDALKPYWEKEIVEYLTNNYTYTIEEGFEADDLMGAIHYMNPTDTIICTIDKDLDMIPGTHYNWSKNLLYEVTISEADRFFYRQLLIGDPVDNVKGIKGIGKVKASKLIPDSEVNDYKMYEKVRKEYLRVYGEENADNELYKTADQLWIHRNLGELWQPPAPF